MITSSSNGQLQIQSDSVEYNTTWNLIRPRATERGKSYVENRENPSERVVSERTFKLLPNTAKSNFYNEQACGRLSSLGILGDQLTEFLKLL